MDGRTLEGLAELICGDDKEGAPRYRTGGELSIFFRNTGLPHRHDGSTRKWWTLEVLRQLQPHQLQGVVLRLADPVEYNGDREQIRKAVVALNRLLAIEERRVVIEGKTPRLERIKVDYSVKDDDGGRELKPLPPPDFVRIDLEPGVGVLLAQRWAEAERCLNAKAFLAGTIIMGSLLEGLLLGVMQRNPRQANQSPSAPKSPSTGAVKHFADWRLSEMIDVGHDVGWIDLDVKRFSHSLREFRNLIHPYEQMATRANPDEDTCKISWLVVQATVKSYAQKLVTA